MVSLSMALLRLPLLVALMAAVVLRAYPGGPQAICPSRSRLFGLEACDVVPRESG